MEQTTITLTQAGHRLGLSYNQILRRVMVGELRGECVDGKWSVDVDAVESPERPQRRSGLWSSEPRPQAASFTP